MKISGVGRVTGLLAALVVVLTAPDARTATAQVVADDFPAAMLAVVQLVALLTAAWVLVILVGGAARLPVPCVPAALRAALFTAVVVTAVAGPAHADSSNHHLDGLQLPDRPATAPLRAAAELPSTRTVTVRSGDTLWSLAASRLPEGTPDAHVARSVARWHVANRQVIGSDPDLILPGQVLAPPTFEQDVS